MKTFIIGLLSAALLFAATGCGGFGSFGDGENSGGPASYRADPGESAVRFFLSESGALAPASEGHSKLYFSGVSDKIFFARGASRAIENARDIFGSAWNAASAGRKTMAVIFALDSYLNIIRADFIEVSGPEYGRGPKTLSFACDWNGSSEDALSAKGQELPADGSFTNIDSVENSLLPAAGLSYGKSLVLLFQAPDPDPASAARAPLTGRAAVEIQPAAFSAFRPASFAAGDSVETGASSAFSNAIPTGGASATTTIMAAMVSMVSQIDSDIKAEASEVQERNKQIKANNDRMAELRTQRQKNITDSGEVINKELDQKLQTEMDDLKSSNDGLQNSNQMDMIRLQNYMNARNTAFDTVTNLLSKDQKSRDDITGNLR